MHVFTFFGEVPKLDLLEEQRLKILWAERWQAMGFTPVVLNEWQAKQHPRYDELAHAYRTLPSINPVPYEFLCTIRWVAMAMAPVPKGELFVMSDADTIPYDVTPLHHYGSKSSKSRPFERLVSYQKHVPACVLGHRALFEQQAVRFAEYKPEPDDMHDTTPHCSDMTILQKQAARQPETLTMLDIVKTYGEPGWETAPIVHYANAGMGPAKKLPRSTHIPLLR